MEKDYIQYKVEEQRCDDKNTITTKLVTIPYKDLEKYKDCIDWRVISDNVTKDTCTKDFYDMFNENLNWSYGRFIEFVNEDDFYEYGRMDKVTSYHLFSIKQDLSEKFCRNFWNKSRSNNYYKRNDLYYILFYNRNLSTDFIEDVLVDTTRQNSYDIRYIMDPLIRFQKITEDQYDRYIDGSLKNYITKFQRFIVLSKPINNYSVDFINSHRINLNQKAFFDTEQAQQYLSKNVISQNALSVFKTKINYIELLDGLPDQEVLKSLIPVCKKELFDVLIKHSGEISNQESVDYIRKLLV